MSDNHQRYRSIKKALMQMYPKAKGQAAKAMNTLAAMISGIVGSKSTNYGDQEPIYLVTNLELIEEACHWYAKRFRIETFFSDQKSRGFNLHKSHLSAPCWICRLMIASCLAYVWMIYLGTVAQKRAWIRRYTALTAVT